MSESSIRTAQADELERAIHRLEELKWISNGYTELLDDADRRLIDVALSALRARTDAWQPMSTARKDGAPILAATKFLGQPCVVRIYWDRGKWVGDHNNQMFDAWQPLPSPPTPAQEEQK